MKVMEIMGSTSLRLFLAAGCMAAAYIPVWRLQHDVFRHQERAARFDTSNLPLKLGTWSGTDVQIDDVLLHSIGVASATQRSYTDNKGTRISVFMASSSAADCLIPHPPTDCYPGAGWTIDDIGWQTAGGKLRYHLMRAAQNGQSAIVMYWYQIGADVVLNRDELRTVLQKRRWNKREIQPMVKVLLHIPVVTFPENRGVPGAESFATEIYTWIEAHS